MNKKCEKCGIISEHVSHGKHISNDKIRYMYRCTACNHMHYCSEYQEVEIDKSNDLDVKSYGIKGNDIYEIENSNDFNVFDFIMG
jgi:flavoprotein